MSLTAVQSFIREQLNKKSSSTTNQIQFSSVGGGCINETYRIQFGKHQFFCKINFAVKFPQLFEKEKNGLELIAKQNIIKVPKLIDCFEANDQQILLLEWIHEGDRTESFWEKFGEQLAALHQVNNNYFGLYENNYMGSVPQSNQPTHHWTDFFIQQRLQPLIEKCRSRKILASHHQIQFEILYKKLSSIFDTAQKPSLLHGDLWSGNFMCNEHSEPVLIDTAVYFGHPSIDLGMTTLFGGFHSSFYEAYNYQFSLSSNHKEQWEVCNLYPLLIHLYLFGKSYLPEIEKIVNRFA